MCGVNAYSEAVKLFIKKDPLEMARSSGSLYDSTSQIFTMDYMGIPTKISYPGGKASWDVELPLTKNDHVLILQYLVNSCGVRPRGTWIPFIQLPDGPNHQNPFVIEALEPLAKEFGDDITRFKNRIDLFNGEILTMADCSAVINVFPFMPLAVSLWQGDDEFPSNTTILFDITAPIHLSTAALWVLGVELSRKLRGTTGQQFVNTEI